MQGLGVRCAILWEASLLGLNRDITFQIFYDSFDLPDLTNSKGKLRKISSSGNRNEYRLMRQLGVLMTQQHNNTRVVMLSQDHSD